MLHNDQLRCGEPHCGGHAIHIGHLVRRHRRGPQPGDFRSQLDLAWCRISAFERWMPYKTASTRSPRIVCNNADGADAPEAKIPVKLLSMARDIDNLSDHDSRLVIIRRRWGKLFDVSLLVHLAKIQSSWTIKRKLQSTKTPTFVVTFETYRLGADVSPIQTDRHGGESHHSVAFVLREHADGRFEIQS
jgi:hypothetical protein